VQAPVAAAPAPAPVAGMYYGPGAAVAAPAPVPAAKPVMDIANAALEAAFGGGDVASPPPTAPVATKILVLLNMVMDEDLESEEDYVGLTDEVREECQKFGKLLSMKIPRVQDGFAPSAIKKIFLEYATAEDSIKAERELAGRQFGPAVVEAAYFSEDDYANGKLS